MKVPTTRTFDTYGHLLQIADYAFNITIEGGPGQQFHNMTQAFIDLLHDNVMQHKHLYTISDRVNILRLIESIVRAKHLDMAEPCRYTNLAYEQFDRAMSEYHSELNLFFNKEHNEPSTAQPKHKPSITSSALHWIPPNERKPAAEPNIKPAPKAPLLEPPPPPAARRVTLSPHASPFKPASTKHVYLRPKKLPSSKKPTTRSPSSSPPPSDEPSSDSSSSSSSTSSQYSYSTTSSRSQRHRERKQRNKQHEKAARKQRFNLKLVSLLLRIASNAKMDPLDLNSDPTVRRAKFNQWKSKLIISLSSFQETRKMLQDDPHIVRLDKDVD